MTNLVDYNLPIEYNILNIGEKLRALRWVFQSSARRYYYLNNLIIMPIIIFQTTTGIIQLADSHRDVYSITSGCIQLAISLVLAIQRHFNLEERSHVMKDASYRASDLISIIEKEMNLPRDYRKQCEMLMKELVDGYQELTSKALLVPSKIIQNYKRINPLGIKQPVPDILDGEDNALHFTSADSAEELDAVFSTNEEKPLYGNFFALKQHVEAVIKEYFTDAYKRNKVATQNIIEMAKEYDIEKQLEDIPRPNRTSLDIIIPSATSN